MFAVGILMMMSGYAAVYTGIANLINGGNGPTFRESMGFKTPVAPPGNGSPNLTGQPPVEKQAGGGTPAPQAVGEATRRGGGGTF